MYANVSVHFMKTRGESDTHGCSVGVGHGLLEQWRHRTVCLQAVHPPSRVLHRTQQRQTSGMEEPRQVHVFRLRRRVRVRLQVSLHAHKETRRVGRKLGHCYLQVN